MAVPIFAKPPPAKEFDEEEIFRLVPFWTDRIEIDSLWGFEKESGLRDEIGEQVAAVFHQIEYTFEAVGKYFGRREIDIGYLGLEGRVHRNRRNEQQMFCGADGPDEIGGRNVDAFCFEERKDLFAISRGGQTSDPFVVEPFCFFKIEFCASLVNAVHGESLDELFPGEDLLGCAVVPATHRQQIDKRLGEKTCFTETGGGFSRAWVCPVHGENGEAESVAVAFGQLAIPIGFQYQR